jgi:archaeal flagellar protein FlaI
MATMHADDSQSAVRRLTQKPMDIPQAYVPLMNCIINVKRVKLKSEHVKGKDSSKLMGRRVTEVTEIVSPTEMNSVFTWDPHYDGYLDNLAKSHHLSNIAQDLIRRRTILNWLVNRGTRDYKSISKIIGMFNQEPERLMAKVESS